MFGGRHGILKVGFVLSRTSQTQTFFCNVLDNTKSTFRKPCLSLKAVQVLFSRVWAYKELYKREYEKKATKKIPASKLFPF